MPSETRIWIDGDSCPRDVRAIVERAAKRRAVPCIIVANRTLPAGTAVQMTVVSAPATADEHILSSVREGDLVITRDIPLAEEIVNRGIDCMNDRGELFTPDSVRARRRERDRMEELRRATGLGMGKNTFGKREIKAFADTFDRYLSRRLISPESDTIFL